MNTKKIIAVLMMLLVVTSVFAKSKKKKSNVVEVGGTLTLGVPAFSKWELDWGNPDNKPLGAFDLGFGVLANIPLDSVAANFGIQPELHVYSNAYTGKFATGWGVTKEYTFKYWSVDVPVLATYKVDMGDFKLIPEGGLQISIPLGKMKIPNALGGDQTIDTGFLLGLVLGIGASYEVGPGSIVGDIRFITDLGAIKVDSERFLTRRGILLNAGYKVPLN